MQCCHCGADYHPDTKKYVLGGDPDAQVWQIVWETCPRCTKFNVRLEWGNAHVGNNLVMFQVKGKRVIHPKGGLIRKPAPVDVPQTIAEDYNEACLVLGDSPKASAALSRRCLQGVLRGYAKVKPQDLSKEIDEVLASQQLPSYLAADIDAIRHYGNFATHPIKSTSSGQIVPVEPGEAEWQLELLEALFDFYFVGPAESQRKRDALNAKLADAKKPPMKTP
jgi:Domain of unknown function (DUF4145)